MGREPVFRRLCHVTSSSGFHQPVAIDFSRDSAGREWTLFSPQACWLFLRRNVMRVALVGAVTGAVTFMTASSLFTSYSATAVLLVDPREAKVAKASGVIANIGADAVAIESLVQATRSQSFLGDLVDQLKLAQNDVFAPRGVPPEKLRLATIEKLGGALAIARRGTTYVIDVTFSSSSPKLSAEIVNAAAMKIQRDQAGLRSGANDSTAQEIEQRLKELQVRVARAEEASAQLKAQLHVTDVGQGGTLLERRLTDLSQQLVLANTHTVETRARHDLLRKMAPTTLKNAPESLLSPLLGALLADHARLMRDRARQNVVLGPLHPEVKSLSAQIGDVNSQIASEIQRMVVSTHTQLLEAERREADLTRELDKERNRSGELGLQLVKLAELDREAKAERDIYEDFLSRQRELRQLKNMIAPSDIRVVSRAEPPSRPVVGKTVIAVGSAVLGLLTGVAGALLSE
jgi:succinoglycan biosynthesis transport protein ExoP